MLRLVQAPELPPLLRADENVAPGGSADATPHYLAHRMRLRRRFLEASRRRSPIMNCSSWYCFAPFRAAI